MLGLREKYLNEVIPEMKKIFGYKNDLAVPCLETIKINVGVGQALRDDKFIEATKNNLMRISGQRPVFTRAKKSVSAFKIRKGMIVGEMVTLRGDRMYQFADKLINVTLPRVRDFRGLERKGFSKGRSFTIGFKEHIVFPEIKADEVEKLHGLEVTIVTTAKSEKEAFELLKLLGFPFKEK